MRPRLPWLLSAGLWHVNGVAFLVNFSQFLYWMLVPVTALGSFGASPQRVMAWQVVAIVLSTGFTAAVAHGLGAAVLTVAP